jgi:hypothetical protein
MGDRFLLHGGVRHNPFEIVGLDRSAPVRHRQTSLATARRSAPHPAALAPTGQRRAVERQLVGICTEVCESKTTHLTDKIPESVTKGE